MTAEVNRVVDRAIVIGCPGAGKSTFSRRLRDLTGLPLHYLDMLWHLPDGSSVSREKFDAALEQILSDDRWIIDGNYSRTLERRLEKCDTVYLFDLPVEICVAGAAARIGRQREDLPWLETVFDEEFRKYILNFPKENLPEIYNLLDKYKNTTNIYIFKSHEEADRYLDRLSDEITR